MAAIQEVDKDPSLPLLYAKAAATSLRRGGSMPDTELVRSGVGVDRDHLAAYARVCGFPITDELPITYPHVLAFPLAVKLMAQPSFPMPLPGLVHIRNAITRHRAVRADERLTVRVRLADLRPHPKGRQFDVVAVVEVGGETVWESISTNLQRGSGEEGADTGPDLEHDGLRDTARWQVDGDTGRRYAGVSGDVNPIHLHALSARLFGFPKPIAHGMWTKARALAALSERLPDAVTAEAEFRKPLLLPATVRFAVDRTDDGYAFAVRSRSGSAHLLGRTRRP